tara:strand:- start:98 stop:340 length:243 start_codon:yes stop_codon:yes gene_type:complete
MNESVKSLCLAPERSIKQAIKALFGVQSTCEPTKHYINIKSGQWYALNSLDWEGKDKVLVKRVYPCDWKVETTVEEDFLC